MFAIPLFTSPASSFSNCAVQNPPSRIVDPTANHSSKRAKHSTVASKSAQTSLLEQIALDSIYYPIDSAQNSFINKNILYRMIKQDSSVLDSSQVLLNFFVSAATSSFAKFCDIEDSLQTRNFAYADALIAGFSPSNNIEQNYQRFYQIYSNGMQGSFSVSDSTDLEILANSCPRLNGAVVYQARGYHNSRYNEFKHYEDHCPITNTENRAANIQRGVSSNLFVYPNPTIGKIYISGFNGLTKSTHIVVTDVAGKIVLEQTLEVNEGIIELGMPFNNGVYFARITDGRNIFTKKIIIQK